MSDPIYDIIVIGAGSGGLSVGLTMNKLGFRVLMIAKAEAGTGGECLNDGCVPSKALIHVARIIHNAKEAADYGVTIIGKADIKKAIDYVYQKQEIVRSHENSNWLLNQGIDIVLGEATFTCKTELEVKGRKYKGKNIVIATGSQPRKLDVPGVEQVQYFDNQNIFQVKSLPEKILVVGGGPIGIEIAQVLTRFDKKVTVVHHGNMILEHDDPGVTGVLIKRLEKEGIEFLLGSEVEKFNSANEAVIKMQDGSSKTLFLDAVFVGIGRMPQFESLQLQNAGIATKDHKIVLNQYLQTTNKHVFACGDAAGDLLFSHAAEFHARILINNFLSPIKKKLNNDHFSWVTFTDPEIASFGLGEKQLKERNMKYETVEQDFSCDDRAVVDNYQYGKIIMYISKGNILQKEKILGGTMVAPHAGELIQELILANTEKLSIKAIFNKIYPYPVASRINQHLIVHHKEKMLTGNIKKLLKIAYKFFS